MKRSKNTLEPSRAIAFAFAVLVHLAILTALIATGSIHLVPDGKRTAPVDLLMPGATENIPASTASVRPAGVPDEAEPSPLPAVTLPVPSEPPPVEPRPPLPEPLVSEPLDLAALEPRFDAEPDPALTGDTIAAAVDGSITGDAGTACPLAAAIRDALEQNAAARAALVKIPRSSRSVANAVMLWDGRWIAPERVGGATVLGPVREAIAAVLVGASDACRDQAISGPVFVPVDSDAGVVVLVLGSGRWCWNDVLRAGSFRDDSAPPSVSRTRE